jgi:hypothetical protein
VRRDRVRTVERQRSLGVVFAAPITLPVPELLNPASASHAGGRIAFLQAIAKRCKGTRVPQPDAGDSAAEPPTSFLMLFIGKV